MNPFRPQVFLFRMLAAIFMGKALFYWLIPFMPAAIQGLVLKHGCCSDWRFRRGREHRSASDATTLGLLAGGTQLSSRRLLRTTPTSLRLHDVLHRLSRLLQQVSEGSGSGG